MTGISNSINRNRSSTQIEVNSVGHDVTTVNGAPSSDYQRNLTLLGGSVMVDSVHPNFFLPAIPGVLTDWGGPLDLIKIRYDFPIAGDRAGNAKGSYVKRTYTGSIHAQPYLTLSGVDPAKLWLHAQADNVATRWGLGASAIENCRPAKPQAAFGTFLAELLRDGIPSLLTRLQFRSELEAYQSLGNAYLNVEFGWKLFVSDIQATARALLNQVELLEDLSRNSGKRMRRQYSFPTAETVDVAKQAASYYPWPTLTSAHWQQAGAHVTTTTSKRTWFAGEFVYMVPPITGLNGIRAKARYLLGVELTPSYLWQIAPWTWLSDWFANIGDVLANISSITEDNLVIRYAYLMQEARKEVKTTHHGVKTLGDGLLPDTIEGRTVISHKTRIGASPYGFGIAWDGLTLRQTAILAALGITRAGR